MANDIPEMMLAAQIVEYKKPYKIHQLPTPGKDLDEHDILIKVAAASLCHTDGMVSEGIMGTTLPCIASHEGAGTVVKVGTSVKKFKVGDRVLCTLHYHRCGDCEDCTRPEGETQYCQKNKGALGITMDGFFAEYEVVDGRECCLLPDNLSFQSAAPLACAGLTAWGALVRANLKAGDRIAFVGAGGGVGAIGVQFAKALGLYVIGIDARDEGLALAEEMGADKIIDARFGKDKVVEEVRKVTEVKGVDVSLIVSDNELATSIGAAITRKHGLLIQIAQPPNVTVPFTELVFRDIRIHGSLIGSVKECQKMLDCVSKHHIKIRTIVFNGIMEIPKAIELAHSGKAKGKPVILIDNEAIEGEKKAGLKMI